MEKRRSRAEWVKDVAKWKASGETSAAYALRHGLKKRSLLWWSSELGRKGLSAVPVAPSVSFVEVAGLPAAAPIRVRFRDAELDVASGADEATLMTVLRALRSLS